MQQATKMNKWRMRMSDSFWTMGAREHDGIVEGQQRDGPEVAAVAAEAQEPPQHQQSAPARVSAPGQDLRQDMGQNKALPCVSGMLIPQQIPVAEGVGAVASQVDQRACQHRSAANQQYDENRDLPPPCIQRSP